MRWIRTILVLTFLESCATIFVERGIYFGTEYVLGFSKAQNLWMALGFGAAYVVGASLSHPISRDISEKWLLMFTIAGQLLVHSALAVWMVPVALYIGQIVLGLLNGLKWPLIESYVSAGYDPHDTARAVGRFNVSWAAAVPVTLIVSGPAIRYTHILPGGVLTLAAACNAITLLLALRLGRRPAYLPHDHPTRPDPARLARLRTLMVGSRWLLLGGYSLMFILGPVLPQVFKALDTPVTLSPALSSVMDMMRLTAFIVLGRWIAWHGKIAPLVVWALGLPVGFFLAVFGGSIGGVLGSGPGLAAVLVGEVLFGLSVGGIYNAALYYGMVVKNASVDAGGAHESLIGTGFAIGPAAGLAGVALVGVFGSEVLGTIAGVSPIVLLCFAGSAWTVLCGRRTAERHGTGTAKDE